MKKIYSLLAAALVTGFCAAPASAGQTYISGNVGSSWMNDTKDGALKYGMNNGITALGAIGMRENCYRFEVSWAIRKMVSTMCIVRMAPLISAAISRCGLF